MDLADYHGVLSALTAVLEALAADRSRIQVLREKAIADAAAHVVQHFRSLGQQKWMLLAMRAQV